MLPLDDRFALYFGVGVGLFAAAGAAVISCCSDKKTQKVFQAALKKEEDPLLRSNQRAPICLKKVDQQPIQLNIPCSLTVMSAELISNRLEFYEKTFLGCREGNRWESFISKPMYFQLFSHPNAESSIPQEKKIKMRAVAGNGDCFFLSYAVNLLELIQREKNGYFYKPFLEVVLKEKRLDHLDKEFITDLLEEVKNGGSINEIFKDTKKMYTFVSCLRSLMASAVDVEEDTEELFFYADSELKEQIADNINKEKEVLYTDWYHSLDEWEKASFSKKFSYDNFKKMQSSLLEHDSWPSDKLIQRFFLKVKMGLTIFQYDERSGMKSYFDLESLGVDEIGIAFLLNEHYTPIYLTKSQRALFKPELPLSS